MASKKNVFLSGIICLFASASFAQVQTGYDVKDSSLIPASRQPQHNEFLNNAYPFPAKPRNQWEIGIKGGISSVASDVRSVFPTGGFGLHVRKALGYVFSLRAEYTWNRARGLNFSSSNGYTRNPTWVAAGYNAAAGDKVFYNYKTTIQDLSLQGVVTLNNVRFHKAKTGFNIYAFGGIGGSIYDTYINAKNDAGAPYRALFNSTASGTYSNRKDIKKILKAGMDKSYETHAETDPLQPKLFGKSFKPSFQIGVGMAFKLSNKFNLAIEERFTSIKTDLLDGQQWQENQFLPSGLGVPAMTRDFDSYNFFSVGLNYNLGKKSVEPLWWANPLDYAYNEINAPRHMKLPKPVLDDADGDGVTDQFDHEPNTPAGAPVDTHGVTKDTDGDGVPDFKDKELITPTQCQPVDADGVGKCPPPACCLENAAKIDSILQYGVKGKGCGIGDLPSVSFTGRSVTLSKDAQAVLAGVAEKMRNNANCKVAVSGYGESSKAAQQLSWDRVNSVIKYLVEKEGISEDRFIFKFGLGEGDSNTIDLKDGTDEKGPNTIPAPPHPNLRKKK